MPKVLPKVQAQIDARYEDFLNAEQEKAQAEDYDPFASVAELGYELHDAEYAGYDEASDQVKIEVNSLLAQAEALGIDTDTIKEDAYEATKNGSEQDYHEAAIASLKGAIEASNGNRSQDAGQQGDAGIQEGLIPPTKTDILAQQERAEKAARDEKAQRSDQDLKDKKDREHKDIAKASEGAADSFTLGGDAMQNLTGQEDIFSQPNSTENDGAAARTQVGDGPVFSRATPTQQLPRLANQSPANALNATLARYFKGDDHVYRSVNWGRGSAASDVRQAFRAAFGASIEFVQSDTGGPLLFNGFNISEQPSTLFVNVDGNVNFISISGHELWHNIQRQRPDLIEWYRENSRQYYKDLRLIKPGSTAYCSPVKKPTGHKPSG
jgi:hypothetical protein